MLPTTRGGEGVGSSPPHPQRPESRRRAKRRSSITLGILISPTAFNNKLPLCISGLDWPTATPVSLPEVRSGHLALDPARVYCWCMEVLCILRMPGNFSVAGPPRLPISSPPSVIQFLMVLPNTLIDTFAVGPGPVQGCAPFGRRHITELSTTLGPQNARPSLVAFQNSMFLSIE